MSALEIVPSKLYTVTRLMQISFPGIKGTDGERTPLVSKQTIGYIHALMIDTVTTLTTEPPRARALRNETMVVEELELSKDVFRSELTNLRCVGFREHTTSYTTCIYGVSNRSLFLSS